MPYESAADLPMYNRQVLIGCTDERGSAWHRRDHLMGDESNHYPGLIPLDDVRRRLFTWQPTVAKVAYLLPDETGSHIGDDGHTYRVVETTADRIGVLRDDNDADLGVFKSTAHHAPYQVSLIREAERLTGTTLGVSTAGILGRGERAWVEFSMPETLHDPRSGLDYRPNLVRADSMDGSTAMVTFLSCWATICGNTLTWNMAEAANAGRIYRRKHTAGVVGSLDDERAALGILERIDTEFLAGVAELIATPVTPKQQIEVMDILLPLPDEPGRGYTVRAQRRDQLQAMGDDPMVSQWIGTAFGEVQRYSTFDQWFAPMAGGDRLERNVWRGISGKRGDADRQVVGALAKVLA